MRGLQITQSLRFGGRSRERSFRKTVIVANLGLHNGIAMGARYQYDLLKNLGLNVSVLDTSRAKDQTYVAGLCEGASVFIFHCGAPETVFSLRRIMPYAAKAYRIAYWAWELPDPEPSWRGYDSLVDEIWTPSRFSRDSIAKIMSKPLFVAPHFIEPKPSRRQANREVFKVLVMADSRSSFSRKNPAGAVRAFQEAFQDSPSAQLLIKLSGRENEIQSFIDQTKIAGRPNISIIQSKLSTQEMAELYRSVDVVLSLHRSEGFGLPMLEAMSCGTPVIATNWSGNSEFIDRSNGYPIDFKLVEVEDEYKIYTISHWADPDIGMAARTLQDLYRDRDKVEAMSRDCFQFVAENYPRMPLGHLTRSDRFLQDLGLGAIRAQAGQAEGISLPTGMKGASLAGS